MRFMTTTIAVLGVAGLAAADSVNLQYTGPGAGQSFSVVANGNASTAYAGQYNFIASGGTGAGAAISGALRTFCIDVLEPVTGGAQPYDLAELADAPVTASGDPAMGAAKAEAIARMYAFAGGQQFGSSNDYAAAFQLAVWEVIADFGTSLDIADGDFEVTSSVGTGVSGILGDLLGAAGDTSLTGVSGLGALTNNGLQDQIYSVVIPLPGAAGLAAAGLCGIAVTRRRRMA